MNTDHLLQKRIFSTGILLLVTVLLGIFIVPLFPAEALKYLYPAFFSGIFLFSALTLTKDNSLLLKAALFIVALLWVNVFLHQKVLGIISRALQFIFFFFLVAALIKQVASTDVVRRKAIVDAITGYFLLGLAFTMLVLFASILLPNAYNLQGPVLGEISGESNLEPVREYMYYTFITYTTTGYGDIFPRHPATKSLAMLIGVSGQLYVATILAMLIGKYSSYHK